MFSFGPFHRACLVLGPEHSRPDSPLLKDPGRRHHVLLVLGTDRVIRFVLEFFFPAMWSFHFFSFSDFIIWWRHARGFTNLASFEGDHMHVGLQI